MPDLRIGMDFSPLVLTRAGTARYVRSLVEGLREAGTEIAREYSFGGPARPTRIVRDAAWYLAALPLLARRDRLDVLHCPTIRAPIRSRVPLVVTVHDLAVLRHPETFNRWTRYWSRLTLPHVARGARRIVAVSEFTRDELVDLLGSRRGACTGRPKRRSAPFSPDGPRAEGEYVLAVSTLEPRKNLRAARGGLPPGWIGLELRVVGAPGWGDVAVEGEQVRLLGDVGDDRARARSTAAPPASPTSPSTRASASPCSRRWPAALPSCRHGAAPARSSRRAPQSLSTRSTRTTIAAGLRRAAASNGGLRELGLARARELTWERTARETLAVYEEAAA